MADPHYHGHRLRLRERFKKTGLEGLQEYEALELLLTYALPRRDIKPLAKALMEKFGGFHGVLDASHEELSSIDGIKDNTAIFLALVKQCSALYLKEKTLGGKRINSTRALLDYCRLAMEGLKDEQFRAIFLSAQNEIIADEVVFEGTVNQSAVYPRKVMERALAHKAVSLIFVHNHPGGSPRPSQEDKRLTNQLVAASRSLNIHVLDHLIIAKGGHFSFFDSGLL